MDDQARIKRWQRRMKSLESEYFKAEPHWKAIARLMLSKTHGPLFEEAEQAKSARPEIYDTTGIESLRTLASGMQGGLTSPSRPWFKLGLAGGGGNESEDVQAWLYTVQESMNALFQRSNFYDQMHRAYYELGAFGTGVIMVDEDTESMVWFRSLNAGRYYIAVNEKGIVDTLYRKFKLNVAQLMERWSDTLPEHIKSMYANDTIDAKYTVLHVIEPRRDYDPKLKDNLNRPYLSAYVLLDGQQIILEESGYFEKPFIAARWGANYEDTYGYGPASDVLPAVKSLQQINKTLLSSLRRETDPPLLASTSLKNSMERINTAPGYVTYADSFGPRPAIEPLMPNVRANFAAADPQIMRYQEQVKSGLYYKLFLMLSDTSKAMTATEVVERNAEKMILLGPTLERLRSELFEPLIVRVFAIMERSGSIPEPPEQIAGQPIKIEFISMLAQAQKAAGLESINQAIGMLGAVAQLKPAALDKLNEDRIINAIEDMLGIDPGIIRGDDEANAIRRAREQAQMQAMRQQQAMMGTQMLMDGIKSGAGAMKDLSAAGLPVNDMLGQMSQAGQTLQ